MKGDESKLVWSILKKELDKRRWIYQRLEDKAAVGIPDVNIHVPSADDVWVEMKYIPLARPDQVIHVGLSNEQFIWLRDNKKAGRNCWLLARMGNTWLAWNDARDWELAKRRTQWSELVMNANRLASANAYLDLLL